MSKFESKTTIKFTGGELDTLFHSVANAKANYNKFLWDNYEKSSQEGYKEYAAERDKYQSKCWIRRKLIDFWHECYFDYKRKWLSDYNEYKNIFSFDWFLGNPEKYRRNELEKLLEVLIHKNRYDSIYLPIETYQFIIKWENVSDEDQ